jgi:hypothetical protein
LTFPFPGILEAERRWSFELMNTKDFLRLGVPLGEAARRPPSFHYGATSTTDVISILILGGDRLRKLSHIPLDRSYGYVHFSTR